MKQQHKVFIYTNRNGVQNTGNGVQNTEYSSEVYCRIVNSDKLEKTVFNKQWSTKPYPSELSYHLPLSGPSVNTFQDGWVLNESFHDCFVTKQFFSMN